MKKKYIEFVVLIGFLLRLAFLFYSENSVSSELETYSRINMAIDWINGSTFYPDLNFSTLYNYVIRIVFLFGENIIFLRLVSVLFGTGLIFVFYKFAEILFSAKNALASACLLACLPLAVKLSTVSLPMVIYVFCSVLAFVYLLKYLYEAGSKKSTLALSGLMFTIASGFRFEGFLLMFIISLLLFFRLRKKEVFIFMLTAGIFPFLYMCTSYFGKGVLFLFLSSSQADAHAVTRGTDELARVWSYFVSLGEVLNPFVLALGGLGILFALLLRHRSAFTALFICSYLLVFLVKTYNGTFLSDLTRYYLVMVVFIIPFFVFALESLGVFLQKIISKKLVKKVTAAVVLLLMFFYLNDVFLIVGKQHIHADEKSVLSWLKKNVTDEDSLFLDRFMHPYFSVELGAFRKRFVLVPFTVSDLDTDELVSLLKKNSPAYVTSHTAVANYVLKGIHFNMLKNEDFAAWAAENMEEVYVNSSWSIYRYKDKA